MLGGPDLSRQGARAVPSLTYLERQPPFSIGPEQSDDDNIVPVAQMAALGQQSSRAKKTARGMVASAANIVPQGGVFWDGRADTLQDQALLPLLDPREMDGGSLEIVAEKLRRAPYAERFVGLFGAGFLANSRFLVSEAMFAVARYQFEEPSFHPYTSKYDFWLEGKARLSESEWRGLQLFNDPDKANCGGCHLSGPTRDGLPPLFTDHQYEALGAPRNVALADNRDPSQFDLGVCGPQPHRHRRPDAILRNVPDTHLAQHGDPPRVLPQRRLQQPAAGARFLQFSRYESGESLSARRGRKVAEIRRPSGEVSCQC
jgi:cytochrome c peroxidase